VDSGARAKAEVMKIRNFELALVYSLRGYAPGTSSRI
jgi:hypothetical protein